MINIIFLTIIIYYFMSNILKKDKNKLNINIDIEKNNVSNMTRILFKEYNEPCILNLKDKNLKIII